MSQYKLHRSLWLPRSVEELFGFFSNAHNLQELTPPWVEFQILTPAPIKMGVGTLIDYKIRVHRIPLRWRTLISRWEPPMRFVDQQIRGPYRTWIHEHRFEAVDGGTKMTDDVTYDVLGGALVHRLFVRSDVERIFDYREQRMRERFGVHNDPSALAV